MTAVCKYDDINMNLKDNGLQVVEWIHLAHGKDQSLTLANI
jgi:hypothetical protein